MNLRVNFIDSLVLLFQLILYFLLFL